MLTVGRTKFDYVNELHTDNGTTKESLGIVYGIPSEPTLTGGVGEFTETQHKAADVNIDGVVDSSDASGER